MLTHVFSELVRQLRRILLHSYCILLHNSRGENRFMPVPVCFVWTRFGTEAGQSISSIFARKEQERIANKGLFFWGIGNAIGPSVGELLRRTTGPEALFSPIRSTPRREDVAPTAVAAWTEAETLSGEKYRLPERSLITSRYDHLSPRNVHYALVCFSETQISMSGSDDEIISLGELRNLLTGRSLGASQVTAVVYRDTKTCDAGSPYNVAARVKLVPPYFVRLRKPMPLERPGHLSEWDEVVRRTWEGSPVQV